MQSHSIREIHVNIVSSAAVTLVCPSMIWRFFAPAFCHETRVFATTSAKHLAERVACQQETALRRSHPSKLHHKWSHTCIIISLNQWWNQIYWFYCGQQHLKKHEHTMIYVILDDFGTIWVVPKVKKYPSFNKDLPRVISNGESTQLNFAFTVPYE